MDEIFVYLDYNATTPTDPRVADTMRPYLTGVYGNPSSSHFAGREARRAVENARAQVASAIHARPEEIVFTSGGSESNNLAIRGLVAARGGGHVVTSAVEHPAVLEVVRALAHDGAISLTILEVDRWGRVDPAKVEKSLRADTILLSLMLANNEVGTLQPVREVAALCRKRGIVVHTDAAQALGKISVDVEDLGVDLLSIAGHKLYAPKGIGALYVRTGIHIEPLIRGANHEMGLRAGTENVLEQVGLGQACALAAAEVAVETESLRVRRDQLLALLRDGFPAVEVHSDPTRCLPNTLSVAFPGVDAGLLLARIGDTVAASAGAACHADKVEVSHVLEAMGISTETALSTIRLSVGRFTTPEEIEVGARRILSVVRQVARGEPSTSVSGADEVRLTQFTHGLGCGCKIHPHVLEEILQGFEKPTRPEVVVGVDGTDDAAAWRLPDGTILVQTVDFFTPVVDEPRLFGAIAAANALSDVYAMGAVPLFALNIVAFPISVLPVSVLEEIMAGAAEVAEEAGIPVLGGHSIEDTEPKFGWVVTGTTTENGLWKNSGAERGNVLIITKPLGTGVWATAAKDGAADQAGWIRAKNVMRSLNRRAADVLRTSHPRAVTDVTGFGLLGHLREMALGSGVDIDVWSPSVPVLEGTRRLVSQGHLPGGSRANLNAALRWADFDPGVDEISRAILSDAQTSGGLLAAVERDHASEALTRLEEAGVEAAVIGVVAHWGTGRIRVLQDTPFGEH